jgi:hypothetical protein
MQFLVYLFFDGPSPAKGPEVLPDDFHDIEHLGER